MADVSAQKKMGRPLLSSATSSNGFEVERCHYYLKFESQFWWLGHLVHFDFINDPTCEDFLSFFHSFFASTDTLCSNSSTAWLIQNQLYTRLRADTNGLGPSPSDFCQIFRGTNRGAGALIN